MHYLFPLLRAVFVCTLPLLSYAEDSGSAGIELALAGQRSSYYWHSTPVGNTAQLLTVFCRECNDSLASDVDVPLISVLRDTLGDLDPANDRLDAVWLLSYIRPTIGQRILSAVPFFYWHIGSGAGEIQAGEKSAAPLIDLTALQHPMLNALGRNLLQWAMLDSAATPIRASSHAYRKNEGDNERLHLEEAIAFLRSAPEGDDRTELTGAQRSTVIARLELRKTLLGGLASEKAARRIGEQSGSKLEETRSRNWELIRQCAEKTHLFFEPFDLAGTSGQYAMLWLPLDGAAEPGGTDLKPVWKLLHIKDPWANASLRKPGFPVYTRSVDENDRLLPFGVEGVRQIRLTPVSLYHLNFPRMPLLLVNFRTTNHLRWKEFAQRSVNEVTAGVIGISHFTNWYYYVAADLYDFVVSRHGGATNEYQRLDCYAEFRVRLELDQRLDRRLRADMQNHLRSLTLNPLAAAPEQEIRIAGLRFANLEREAQDGGLLQAVDRDRRAEIARDGQTPQRTAWDSLLHFASFGAYTHRASADNQTIQTVAMYREVQNQLKVLDALTESGTRPEVAYDTSRLQHAVAVLQQQVPNLESPPLRARAIAALQRLDTLSIDTALKTDCRAALASFAEGDRDRREQATAVAAGLE